MRRHVGFKSNFAYHYIHNTREYTPIIYSHIHIGCSKYIYEIHVNTIWFPFQYILF